MQVLALFSVAQFKGWIKEKYRVTGRTEEKEAKELLGTSQEKTFHSGGGHFTLRMAGTLLSHFGIFPEVEANVVQEGGIFWA